MNCFDVEATNLANKNSIKNILIFSEIGKNQEISYSHFYV